MKSLAQFVLYVSSIVLAVGIGAFQIEKGTRDESGSVRSDCYFCVKDSRDCYDVSTSLLYCTKTFEDVYGTGLLSSNNYRRIYRNQCGGWGLTPLLDANGVHTGLYKLPEIFIPDPKCMTEVTTPTSDGCGE